MRILRLILLTFVVVALAGVLLMVTQSQAQDRGRAGFFGGARSRAGTPPVGRRPSSRATVIPNRSGGFDMYSPQGNSRYLGPSQGNKVFHPDGSSSIVIPDNTGGSTVSGPQGTHRVFPDEE